VINTVHYVYKHRASSLSIRWIDDGSGTKCLIEDFSFTTQDIVEEDFRKLFDLIHPESIQAFFIYWSVGCIWFYCVNIPQTDIINIHVE